VDQPSRNFLKASFFFSSLDSECRGDTCRNKSYFIEINALIRDARGRGDNSIPLITLINPKLPTSRSFGA
jgi:hypothetical protein